MLRHPAWGVASAADRGRWSLIDGGEDRVEAAQAAKAGGKRDLGHARSVLSIIRLARWTRAVWATCRLLVLPRSSVYRKPAQVSAQDLAIMALIDRHYLARPYYGWRPMAAWRHRAAASALPLTEEGQPSTLVHDRFLLWPADAIFFRR